MIGPHFYTHFYYLIGDMFLGRHTLWFRRQQKQWELTTKKKKKENNDWICFFFLKRKLVFILNVDFFVRLCLFVCFLRPFLFQGGGVNLIFYDEPTVRTPDWEAKTPVLYLGLKAEPGLCTYPACCHGALLNSQSTGHCTKAWVLQWPLQGAKVD